MSARYLLETSGVDGYLLEDGTGVLLLEDTILPNGDASSTSTPPTLGSGVTLSGGVFSCTSAGQIVTWTSVFTIGQTYSVTLDYNSIGGSGLRANNSATNGAAVMDTKSVTTDGVTRSITFANFVATGTDFSIEADTSVYSGTIDNVVATLVLNTLTGQSVTSAIGTLLAATALALSGASLTGSRGSVAPQASLAISGQPLSVAQGSSAGSVTVALTGQSLSVASGTVSPAATGALSGQSLTSAQGAASAANAEVLTGRALIVAGGNVVAAPSVVLAGQSAVVSSGTTTPKNALTLTGLSLAVGSGSVALGFTGALSGQEIGVAQGSSGSIISAALASQSLAGSLGTVSIAPTDVIISLIGQSLSMTLGNPASSFTTAYKFWRQPPLIGRRTSPGRSR